MVDSYNTDMAAYETDRGQCVGVAMQVQAEYDRHQRLKRESKMIFGAIADALVGSVSCDSGDGAVFGGTLGALKGGVV